MTAAASAPTAQGENSPQDSRPARVSRPAAGQGFTQPSGVGRPVRQHTHSTQSPQRGPGRFASMVPLCMSRPVSSIR